MSVYARLLLRGLKVDAEDVRRNIDGRMDGPKEGFVQRYFGAFEFTRREQVQEIAREGERYGHYVVPATGPTTDSFVGWLSGVIASQPDGQSDEWGIHATKRNSSGKRFLMGDAVVGPRKQLYWDAVQVVGQLCGGDSSYQDGLVELCRSACYVFASQPTRLFLHGVYIRGSKMELWMLDRSGIFCSSPLDMDKDIAEWLPLLLSYQYMTDAELGINHMIKHDSEGDYIISKDSSDDAWPTKVLLQGWPMTTPEGLVGSGTVCYRGRTAGFHDWDCAVKYKWRGATERPENELLEVAMKKHCWGALFVDRYEEMMSTADLRHGFQWGAQRRFRDAKGEAEAASSDVGGFSECTEEAKGSFQNRILTRVVTSPLGRPLNTYESIVELLAVLRDAVKCHRSLLLDASILHRDISVGTIMMSEGTMTGISKGLLIGLESAVELDKVQEATHGIVGTRPFMAIGVLKGKAHTYRHDLESFLYVLLWVLITKGADSPPEKSRLWGWSRGSWEELAARKSADMTEDGLQLLLNEFRTVYTGLKPLVEELRSILFPLRDGVEWTGTDSAEKEVEELYRGVIGAFEKALAAVMPKPFVRNREGFN